MTKLQKIRDELACNHSEACDFHLSLSVTPIPNGVSFADGFDAACAEWEKMVEPLVEALDTYSRVTVESPSGYMIFAKPDNTRFIDIGGLARGALEDYRKARE